MFNLVKRSKRGGRLRASPSFLFLVAALHGCPNTSEEAIVRVAADRTLSELGLVEYTLAAFEEQTKTRTKLVYDDTDGLKKRALSGEFESDVAGFPDQDFRDDMKDTIWGVTGGLGLRYPLGGFAVGAEGRYRTDFSDLWDIDDNLESIQQGWSLTLVLSR